MMRCDHFSTLSVVNNPGFVTKKNQGNSIKRGIIKLIENIPF